MYILQSLWSSPFQCTEVFYILRRGEWLFRVQNQRYYTRENLPSALCIYILLAWLDGTKAEKVALWFVFHQVGYV